MNDRGSGCQRNTRANAIDHWRRSKSRAEANVNILVVSDSAMIRRIIISGLRKEGYESTNMVEAGDGVGALEAVDAYDFDLI